MQIPNTLSLMRIILVTPFLVAVIYRWFLLALLLFAIAGLSDFFDGYLARRLGQKSVLGSFLDPLGDKLLTTVAFISLSLQGLLPPWLAVIVVAKDLYVVLGAGILHFTGRLFAAEPSLWGKLSTLLQMVAVCAALSSAFWPLKGALLDGLYVTTGLMTIIAFFHYLWHGVQGFSENTAPDQQN